MAAKKKSKKAKATKKAKVVRKTARKAAKKAAKKKAPARKAAKKSVKAPAKAKATRKKAGASARAGATPKKVRKKKQIGEGDYAATRAFDRDQAAFVKKNKGRIAAMGKDAEAALDGPEGDALRAAEATAAGRSRDTF